MWTIWLCHSDYAIAHVGTNDNDNRAKWDDIVKVYTNLIGIIRRKEKHPAIQIIVSAILPRSRDYYETDSMIRVVNSHLRKVMTKDMDFQFICSFRPFMYYRIPKVGLFANHDGGLHLNTSGSNRLKHYVLHFASYHWFVIV